MAEATFIFTSEMLKHEEKKLLINKRYLAATIVSRIG